MTPDSVRQILKLGHDCVVESGAGEAAGFSDAAYEDAGASVAKTAAPLWKQADIIVKVRGVTKKEESRLRADQTVISFFWPAQNPDLLETFKSAGTNAIAMDMVPRISRAQKMDVLSSMANIAGYRAVIEAGNQFGRFFTGQITAAGKVPPPRCSSSAPAWPGLRQSERRRRLVPSSARLMSAPRSPNRLNRWVPNS